MRDISVLMILTSAINVCTGNLLQTISVPRYAFVGGTATISCEFDLRQTQLYSLKWYHNRAEFYRYVPTEESGPVNIRTTPKFYIQEVSRSSHRIMLNLSDLKELSSGEYRCEVIAEHPSFRTEILTAMMTVLREPLSPPVLIGAKDIYDPDDVIEIGCQFTPITEWEVQPKMQWYFNGQLVNSKRRSSRIITDTDDQSTIRLSTEEILSLGGSADLECRLMLGDHQEKKSKVIRVRRKEGSFLQNFINNGSSLQKYSIDSSLWIVLPLVFVFFK